MTDVQSRSRIDYKLLTDRYAESLMSLYRFFFYLSDLPSLGLEFDSEKATQRIKDVARRGGPPTVVIAIDETQEAVIGAVSWAMDTEAWVKPFAYLDKIFVLPNYLHQGVGTTLIHMAMRTAKDDGAIAFRAGMSSGIPGAEKLFLENGFEETPHSMLVSRRL
jgi:GNAT superfamily N-acetyltransferase